MEKWKYKGRFFGVTLDFIRDCSFSILTLTGKMVAEICCIYSDIDTSGHPEVFFKKGVIQICSQFTGEDSFKSITSALLKSHFSMDTLL